MNRWIPPHFTQIWRFLQAGAANTLFGFGLYSLFVAAGLQMFIAQIVCQLIGVAFAYFTYSQHVFVDSPASKSRFMLAYTLHYLVGLGTLALASKVWPSPYAAGLVAILVAAAINFIILRRFVFAARPDQSAASTMPLLRPATVSE